MSFLKDKYFISFLFSGLIFIFALSFLKTNFNFFWYLEKPLSFFNLIVVASIVEEIIFRGVLFDLFKRRYDEKLCLLVTSILFGFSHAFIHSPLWALGTIVPGVLFGVLKMRTKKIYASVTIHLLFNLMYFSLYEF